MEAVRLIATTGRAALYKYAMHITMGEVVIRDGERQCRYIHRLLVRGAATPPSAQLLEPLARGHINLVTVLFVPHNDAHARYILPRYYSETVGARATAKPRARTVGIYAVWMLQNLFQ